MEDKNIGIGFELILIGNSITTPDDNSSGFFFSLDLKWYKACLDPLDNSLFIIVDLNIRFG